MAHTFANSRLRQAGLLRPALEWLHVKQAIHMVDTSQSTRSARLSLAHRRTRRIGSGLSCSNPQPIEHKGLRPRILESCYLARSLHSLKPRSQLSAVSLQLETRSDQQSTVSYQPETMNWLALPHHSSPCSATCLCRRNRQASAALRLCDRMLLPLSLPAADPASEANSSTLHTCLRAGKHRQARCSATQDASAFVAR